MLIQTAMSNTRTKLAAVFAFFFFWYFQVEVAWEVDGHSHEIQGDVRRQYGCRRDLKPEKCGWMSTNKMA